MIPLALAIRRVRAGDARLEGLDAREREVLPPAAVAGRRAEYAAGRRAAHAALEQFLGRTAVGVAVVPARGRGGGPPVAVGTDGAPLAAHLSITHAAGLAAAAVAPLPVGLDLVALEEHGDGLREEAFASGELARWAEWCGLAPAAPETTCLAFAAKEAALKWLGTGLELPLHAVRVEPAGPAVPGRLGGAVAALAVPVRVESTRGAEALEGWIAGNRRRVLVAMCGWPAGGPAR